MRKDQAKGLKLQGKEGRNKEGRIRLEGRNNIRQGGPKVDKTNQTLGRNFRKEGVLRGKGRNKKEKV